MQQFWLCADDGAPLAKQPRRILPAAEQAVSSAAGDSHCRHLLLFFTFVITALVFLGLSGYVGQVNGLILKAVQVRKISHKVHHTVRPSSTSVGGGLTNCTLPSSLAISLVLGGVSLVGLGLAC